MIPLSLISAFLLFHGAFFFLCTGNLPLLFTPVRIPPGILLFSRLQLPLLPTFQELLEWATQLPFYQSLIIIGMTLLTTYLVTRFCRKAAPSLLIILAPSSVPVGLTLLTHQSISYLVASIVYILLVFVLFIAEYRFRRWTGHHRFLCGRRYSTVTPVLFFLLFHYCGDCHTGSNPDRFGCVNPERNQKKTGNLFQRGNEQ